MSQTDSSLAVIDIGSNSVRMVIYDTIHNPPEKTFNEKVVCSLGRDLATTGYLNPQAADTALTALKGYKLLLDAYDVHHLQVVGTASLRDARDGVDFIKRVQSEIGIGIRVISGEAEATYAARGVLMFDSQADGVVADFGGGSLELARVKDNNVLDTVSLPMGAFRVQAMGDEARKIIHDNLAPYHKTFGNLDRLYAIGGSWRVLALAYMRDLGDKQELQGYSIDSQNMKIFCQKIQKATESALIRDYRLESHQARLAGIAAFTLQSVLEDLNPKYFVVSTAGVRDGVAHEFLLSQSKKL
jgi:exopolyphosphatase/guanosine-5'-triphosphate,3'-diphosphate pyrophosphatase